MSKQDPKITPLFKGSWADGSRGSHYCLELSFNFFGHHKLNTNLIKNVKYCIINAQKCRNEDQNCWKCFRSNCNLTKLTTILPSFRPPFRPSSQHWVESIMQNWEAGGLYSGEAQSHRDHCPRQGGAGLCVCYLDPSPLTGAASAQLLHYLLKIVPAIKVYHRRVFLSRCQ